MSGFDPISAAVSLADTIIKRIWADPEQQAEEQRKVLEIAQRGDLAELKAHVDLMQGQLTVNANEAKHKSVFVAGWRPFIGWVGGSALAYQFLLYPLLTWVAFAVDPKLSPPPVLDAGALFSVVTAMLGIGAMRSYDKRGNVETNSFG